VPCCFRDGLFHLLGELSITRVENVRLDIAQQRFAAPSSDTNAVT
jgi:hypothetical protein